MQLLEEGRIQTIYQIKHKIIKIYHKYKIQKKKKRKKNYQIKIKWNKQRKIKRN